MTESLFSYMKGYSRNPGDPSDNFKKSKKQYENSPETTVNFVIWNPALLALGWLINYILITLTNPKAVAMKRFEVIPVVVIIHTATRQESFGVAVCWEITVF